MAKGRQASGNPPTPRAPDKSGQSDCPTIEEGETSRYHAKQETDQRNERTWMCVQRRYRRERGPGYNLWKRCQVGRWDRKKNAALTDCALNKGDTRLLMAVKIPPNEMTGIQCREMDIQRGRNTSENRTHRKRKNRKSPTLQKRGSRFCFLFSVYSDYVAFIIASRCLSLQARFI